jgi:hypothetical protein
MTDDRRAQPAPSVHMASISGTPVLAASRMRILSVMG